MIRKILLAAAAIAMPVAGLTAVSAVAGSGIAGAAKSAPGPITCTQTGTVTFAKPGLSNPASLTKKTSETTKSETKGTGTGCSSKANKLSILSTPTPCSQMSPTPPSICTTGNQTKDGSNYYDAATQYLSGSTLTDLQAALANGIKTTDNGTKVTLEYGTAGASSTCSAGLGFTLTGNVYENGSPISPTPLKYTDNVCLVGDSGPGTTNNFETDIVNDNGSNTAKYSTIAKATIGGNSSLVITDAS